MITIFRKHHRWLMIVIAILAVPFIFYFQKGATDFAAPRSNDLGRIYDRPVTQVEFTRNARILNLSSTLGLTLGQDLMMANVASESEMYVEFTWNRLTLLHEVEELGIHPSANEITEFVKTLPRFRTEGKFDLSKYNDFTKGMLPSLGLNEAQLEEAISDQLALNRLKDLLGVGMQVSESESKENYEKAYGKMEVAVVRLKNEDFEKDVKTSNEDISKYYEAHKAEFKSEQKRRVEFVAFTLTEEEKKLTGKDRVDALQKVANRANDFSQALLEKDAKFEDVAAKFQSPVTATGEFTAAAPDPKLAGNPQLAQYAFQLNQQSPFSDPVQAPDGFYVLHLLGATESHPLTIEEATTKIIDALKAERLRELVANKGGEIGRQIRAALKSGTPLDKAVGPGLKVERIPAFALVEPPAPKTEADKDKPKDLKPKDEKPKDLTPDLPSIRNAVVSLNPGEVSEFVPAGKGGLVAVLEKRAPADPSGYEAAKTDFESRYLSQRRAAIFIEWLRDRRRAAGVTVATG
jgi:hypothetical protein